MLSPILGFADHVIRPFSSRAAGMKMGGAASGLLFSAGTRVHKIAYNCVVVMNSVWFFSRVNAVLKAAVVE